MTAKPKPLKSNRPKKTKASQPRRKILEKQLEAIVKLIIFWRDGQVCVQTADGGCGNGLMWGHYIAQGQSAWLRYDLGNVFVQCGNHNLRDFHGDKSYATWFINTFGIIAAEALNAEKVAHSGKSQRTIQELEDLLAHYDNLYQKRFYITYEFRNLIECGYYGEIIREAYK
jgi:hypothetical protein